MPPTAIRRPLTVIAWLLVSTVCVLASPLVLALGAVAGAITRRPAPLILARLVVVYFTRELGVLIGCGALWLLTGGGRRLDSPRSQRLHWRLLGWLVGGLAETARASLHIEVAEDPSAEAAAALKANGPLLIFSRHAGPGDTMFILDELCSRYRRRPSVVFKETLGLDPCVDLLADRLPHAMLDPSDRDQCEVEIERVSARLGPRGALLLFPEGGNFTPERRRSALRRLRRKGRRRSAEKAERMPHVLPPQPTGALTALRANPHTDILFAAHTGLGLAAYPRELWRQMPIGRTLRTRMWLARAREVPDSPDDQISWLYDWWKRIDEWIHSHAHEAEGSSAELGDTGPASTA
jgi:1-acyl-sn-glycerol-3-phosphate acyltransferase